MSLFTLVKSLSFIVDSNMIVCSSSNVTKALPRTFLNPFFTAPVNLSHMAPNQGTHSTWDEFPFTIDRGQISVYLRILLNFLDVIDSSDEGCCIVT